ncbi:MAG: ATP-binding protein [Flavobacteriales bacterium]
MGTDELRTENARLRERLEEHADALRAIRHGEVDALVDGGDVFVLDSAETASNRFRGQVLEQIEDVVVAVDLEGRITYLNPPAERKYGRRSSDILGCRAEELFQAVWKDDAQEALAIQALSTDQMWRGELEHRTPAGLRIPVEITLSTLRDKDGALIGHLGVMRDITARLQAQKLVEDSSRQKDHFLATLAHELRNPLSPILSGLQMLEFAQDDPRLMDSTRAIMQRQLGHLIRLVDDLMDMSRISRGTLELRKRPIDLRRSVQMAVEAVQTLMDQNGHTLLLRITEDELPVIGDHDRLTQVITNLLTNAARYTPNGGRIELHACTENDQVVVRVKDSGIGLSPEDNKRIFEMFTQVKGGRTGSGGLGIGLNIAQRLAILHRGTLQVQSEGLGKGAEFILRLPLKVNGDTVRPPRELARAAHMPGDTPRRILVVDDNEDGTDTLASVLRQAGHRVETAYNGEQALARGHDFLPDLIFMDIGMPGMTGHEACQRMRKEPWGAGIHIIAVSGWGQEQDVLRSRNAGFDEHVVKPISIATAYRLAGARNFGPDKQANG